MKYLKLTPIFLDIETTGLSPLESEIVAVGIKKSNGEAEVYSRKEHSEKDLLAKAFLTLSDLAYCLIGYNIYGFDLPFLTARAIHHDFVGNWLQSVRNVYRIDLIHVVTHYLLTSNKHIKLAEVAQFLGINTGQDEVSGKDIPELYEKEEFDKIEQHCLRDLEITYQLFEKLKPLCVHNLKRRYRLDCAILFEGSE